MLQLSCTSHSTSLSEPPSEVALRVGALRQALVLDARQPIRFTSRMARSEIRGPGSGCRPRGGEVADQRLVVATPRARERLRLRQ